jgi:carbonic anhydrase
MKRLIDGALRFQGEVYQDYRERFRELATGQQPEALLITCSDSRVMPELIVQAKPGDLFICRNAGNIAPPYSDVNGGVTATIEYAVAVLKVGHIIVCGHSDCGAMKALLHPEKLQGLPSVKSWLHHASRAEVVVRENHPDLDEKALVDMLIEENVLAQLDNLRTHPSVASRLKSGSLQLHGWVYDIESGQIRVSTNQSAFLPMSEAIQNEEGKALHA